MPRAGLSRQAVVAAAADIADEIGLDRLTLAVVAERLGVKLPSLYKHIDSLDGLRRELAALAVGQLANVLAAAAVGRSGGDALRAVADTYRRFAGDHPGRYAATVRAPAPDDQAHITAAAAVLRVVTAVLSGYGLHGDDAIDATRAVRAALHGFVTLEAGRGFGMPQDVDRSFQRMIDGLDATLARWATAPPPRTQKPQRRTVRQPR
jgi:AcrR family transcriptional regulator